MITGRRLLKIWYILLTCCILEIAAYVVSGWIAGNYRQAVWEHFNAGATVGHEVNTKTPYAEYINRYARQSGLSPELVACVIKAESSFQPRALSSSGAYGLMQVLPATWQQVNKELDICKGRHTGACTTECYYNPELNIRIGTAYVAQLNKEFKGNMVFALAAYNAGPGAVKHYGGVPPYRETTEYVNRIVKYWYELAGERMPDYGHEAGQWEGIQNLLGWLLLSTIVVTCWVIRCLYSRWGSWLWR